MPTFSNKMHARCELKKLQAGAKTKASSGRVMDGIRIEFKHTAVCPIDPSAVTFRRPVMRVLLLISLLLLLLWKRGRPLSLNGGGTYFRTKINAMQRAIYVVRGSPTMKIRGHIVVPTLALTRVSKSVVTGQSPVTLELRNTPGKNKNKPKLVHV